MKELDDAATERISDAVDALEDVLRDLQSEGYSWTDCKLAALELLT